MSCHIMSCEGKIIFKWEKEWVLGCIWMVLNGFV